MLSIRCRINTIPVPVRVTPDNFKAYPVLPIPEAVSCVAVPALTAVPVAQHWNRSTFPYPAFAAGELLPRVSAARCATSIPPFMIPFFTGAAPKGPHSGAVAPEFILKT